MKKKFQPYIRHMEDPPKRRHVDPTQIFSVDVQGKAVAVYRLKNRRAGYISVLSPKDRVEYFAISGFWLATFEAIAVQAERGFVDKVRQQFIDGAGKGSPELGTDIEDDDGNPLEVVRCEGCRTQYWSNGETPCPRCSSIPLGIKTPHKKMIIDAEDPPSFEDFLMDSGNGAFEVHGKPVRVAAPPYREDGRPEEPCEDCEGCGDCKVPLAEDDEDILRRLTNDL